MTHAFYYPDVVIPASAASILGHICGDFALAGICC